MPDILVNRSLLKPSRVDIPSAVKIAVLEQGVSIAATPPERELRARAIRLQIRGMQIMDGLQGVWCTNIGSAMGVYLISTVVDGITDEPISRDLARRSGVESAAARRMHCAARYHALRDCP